MVHDSLLKVKFYILLSICLMSFCYSAIKCFEKLTSHDATLDIQLKRIADVTFPAMTICPDYDEAFDQAIIAKYNTTPKSVRKGRYPKGIGSSMDFFNKVATSLETIVDNIKVETLAGLQGTDLRKFYFTTDQDVSFEDSEERISTITDDIVTLQMNRHYGKCYTFQTPQELVDCKIYGLTFTLKMAGVIFPHHPGQFQSQDTRIMLPVERNTYYFLPSSHKLVKSLPVPRSAGRNSNSTFKTTCSESLTWTYDDCIYKAMSDKILQEFGCVAPYFNKFDLEDVCQLQNFSKDKNKIFLQYFKSAIDEYVRDESCNSPCTSMEMAFGHGKISLDNKKHQLKIYFPSQIKFQQSRYTYNIINFLGEIGGYVGLLLGVSVLNLDPVLDKFLRMFKLKRIARPRRSRVKKITKN